MSLPELGLLYVTTQVTLGLLPRPLRGEGGGEGLGAIVKALSIVSSADPHPNPLPTKGEGAMASNGFGRPE